MIVLGHFFLFLVSVGLIWFFAGLLIESVDRVAKRFNTNGFTIAFFVLGFLTSISEISVMVNSSIDHVPQVAVGNLIGASFVILLGIVPFLAVIGHSIRLKDTLKQRHIAYALFVIALPVVFVLDGSVTLVEGIVCIFAYITTLYLIRGHGHHAVRDIVDEVGDELTHHETTTLSDVVKILVGAGIIFIAGHFLVEETVFFSEFFGIPSSIIGLVLLSIGTNLPEIVIAARSVLKKKSDIAFGDYLGSALANTLIFGMLPILNGNFLLGGGAQFIGTAVLMGIGLLAFYHLTKSGRILTSAEGHTLLLMYVAFIILQLVSAFRYTHI